MSTRTIKTPDDIKLLIVYLEGKKLPLTIDIEDGRDRSAEQNRLSHKWYKEISEQTGESVEDVRARCKLEIGVPILRQGSEQFRNTYDRLIRPLDYSDKHAVIRDTDMPITRLMKVEQMSRYMDAVFQQHAEFGIVLTVPPDRFAFDPERRKAA